MDFLEKDLENIIWDAYKTEKGRLSLMERGLPVSGKMFRQLRIGNYGTADLVTFNRTQEPSVRRNMGYPIMEVSVMELKKEGINGDTFFQALKYIKGIQSYLSFRDFSFEVKFNIVLIGRKINKSPGFVYLTDFLSIDFGECLSLHNYTYEYTIDGIHFKDENGYDLVDRGFEIIEAIGNGNF